MRWSTIVMIYFTVLSFRELLCWAVLITCLILFNTFLAGIIECKVPDWELMYVYVCLLVSNGSHFHPLFKDSTPRYLGDSGRCISFEAFTCGMSRQWRFCCWDGLSHLKWSSSVIMAMAASAIVLQMLPVQSFSNNLTMEVSHWVSSYIHGYPWMNQTD